MQPTEKFWQWFTDHNEQLITLGDFDDTERTALLENLQQQLTAYRDGITFDLGAPTANGRTLTFTAEGDTDLFLYVVELVDSAPDLDWWEFVAFKQPCGTPVKVRFDKYSFDSSKMHFMQLENEAEPDILGLRVALPNHVADDDDLLVGTYVTLEAIMGEFDCATLVGYLETCPVPDEPFKEGFRPLDDLPEFVEWFKRKRDAE
ncbi:MAG: hypothetical protein K5650_00845 [Bacteroidales bacterium]|nr:hypothetical protein [Bacteroidales bacterium]